MIKIDLKEGFYVVPYRAVTLNGIPLDALNKENEPYNGAWALICPAGVAVDNIYGRPYYYLSIDQAEQDANTLLKIGECSYCGGRVWKRSKVRSLKRKIMGINTLRKKTIKVLNQTIKHFQTPAYESELSDDEFVEEILRPFIEGIKQDIEMDKQ